MSHQTAGLLPRLESEELAVLLRVAPERALARVAGRGRSQRGAARAPAADEAADLEGEKGV